MFLQIKLTILNELIASGHSQSKVVAMYCGCHDIPALQLVHVATEVAPTAPLYVPAPHNDTEDALALDHDPAGDTQHAVRPVALPNEPAAHT